MDEIKAAAEAATEEYKQKLIYNRLLAQDDRGDEWQFIVDQEDIIQRLELTFSGYAPDVVTGAWKQTGKPWLNATGLCDIMPIVRAVISKNAVANKLEIEEIHKHCLKATTAVIDLLADNYKLYEVNPVYFQPIINAIDDAIFLALKRSDHGVTYEFLKPILKFIKEDKKQEVEQPGMFSFVKPSRGR